VVFTVLHKGVKDRAALAGLWMPDKQPVLRSQFGRADSLFRTVIVDAGLRVIQVTHQCLPLSERIADRLTCFGCAVVFVKDLLITLHALQHRFHERAAVVVSIEDRIRRLLAQFTFIGIQGFDLHQVPGCIDFAVKVKGLVKLAAYVGHAANQLEAFFGCQH